MKKLFLVPVLGLLFASCNGNTNQGNADSTAVDSIATEQPAFTGVGTYTGVLPAADAAGFDTSLELKADGTYTLIQTAKGSTDSISNQFTVNGDTISLAGRDLTGLLQGDSIVLLNADKQAPAVPNVLRKK